MQPMPAKNRTALMAGAALLAVVIGIAAVWSARRGAEPQPQQLDQLMLDPADEAAQAAPTGSESSTPSQAESAATPQGSATAAAVPAEHVVAEGETLRTIAEMYYGDKDFSGYIEELNQLEDADKIKVGDRLKLPRPEALPATGQ